MKIYINELGHLTNMAAMPIYNKKLIKSSSPEPMYDPVFTLTHFTPMSNLGKSENYYFLNTIAALGLKAD